MSNAKSYLVTAKQLMRRIRDKVPYSSGDKMMLSNAGSGWMVEGSPPRLLGDYNPRATTAAPISSVQPIVFCLSGAPFAIHPSSSYLK
jgi:hypothetical protein